MLFKLSHLEFFFWKYYFGHTNFLYLSTRSSRLFFFLVRFSNRKSQSQQKLAKKVTHFIIQFRSKNLTRFTNLNSRTICSRNASKKTVSDFTSFPENIFLFGFRHVSVWFHHFLTPKNHILEALWNQMSVYLRKKIFVPEK